MQDQPDDVVRKDRHRLRGVGDAHGPQPVREVLRHAPTGRRQLRPQRWAYSGFDKDRVARESEGALGADGVADRRGEGGDEVGRGGRAQSERDLLPVLALAVGEALDDGVEQRLGRAEVVRGRAGRETGRGIDGAARRERG